jgi:co-chaperonin GroES (HSP10)
MKSDAPNIRPLGDKVILRRDDKAEQEGGIWLPDQTKIFGWAATVAKTGAACCVKNGTRVFYLRKHTVCPFADRRFVVTEAKYLIARLEPNKAKTYEQVFPLGHWVLAEPDVEHVPQHGVIPSPSHRPERTSRSGILYRVGSDCLQVGEGHRVLYGIANLVRCVENDTELHLIPEDDVLARLT